MMRTSYKILYLLLALICLPVMVTLAADESYIQTLTGKIKKGDSCTVIDDKFLNLPLADWNQVRNLSVNNIISFELRNDTSVFFYNKPFTCTLNVTIQYFTSRDQQTPTEVNNVELVVKYDTATGKYYPATAQYKFKNAFKVLVIVHSITSAELGSNLPAIFRLKNQILVERKYPFVQQVNGLLQLQQVSTSNTASTTGTMSTMAANIVVQPANQQLLITWNTSDFPGAEEFDVEWTYIDALGARGYAVAHVYTTNGNIVIPDATLEEWMRNDNSRVTVTLPGYAINLPYTDGYVAVRIRSAWYDPATNLRLTSNWTYRDASGNPAIATVNAQEPNLNWQYTASFAEEGKRKEVISYFDGSLRGRQAVTINNSDNKAVVQETIYDQMGRPSLNILPAPLNNSVLEFYGGVNKNTAGSPYSYADILLDVAMGNNSCRIGAGPLSNTSGAGAYYSSNNLFLNDPNYYFTKYVPDANGYPYALTEYTPDNTGRIRRQGGVGDALQIGTGHETNYYYGKPSQTELDRLFGMEVGNASHYLKNMVVDPNGQISVSYVDANGKTIATALAGVEPPSVDALPSAHTSDARVRLNQQLIWPADFLRNTASMRMQASATFLAAVTGTFQLHYSINPAALVTTPAASPQFCSNCYYDVSIVVRDDCGNAVATATTAPFQGNDVTCHANPLVITNDLTVTVNKIGEYTVSYVLKLSNDAINFQTDYYIDHNSDLKRIQDFFETELLQLDLSGCYSDCSSCQARLGTLPEFTQRMNDLLVTLKNEKYANYPSLNLQSPNIQGWITATYGSLLADCSNRAATCTAASVCEQYLEMMKRDVLPGGQYALDTLDDNTGMYSYLQRDINVLRFYNLNQPDNDAIYNIHYTDANGNTIYIRDLSESDFIRAYMEHPEWADQFVKKHIEYCSYQWCKDQGNPSTANNNEVSYGFDSKLRETITTGAQAVAAGYFNRANYLALLNADPFFTGGGHGVPYIGQMQQDLLQLSVVLNITPKDVNQNSLPSKNILQLVDWMLYLRPVDANPTAASYQNSWFGTPDNSCRSLTQEWQLYRDYYLKLKSKYVRLAKLAANPDCTDCFIGNDVLTQPVCVPAVVTDYAFVTEATDLNDPYSLKNHYIIYKAGLPFPGSYTATVKFIDFGSTTTYYTVNVRAGDTKAFITQTGGGPDGLVGEEIVSMACAAIRNTGNCGGNVSDQGPCPGANEFTVVDDNFRNTTSPFYYRSNYDRYYVHTGGPVTRPVSVRVGVELLHAHIGYDWYYRWETIPAGSDRVLAGTYTYEVIDENQNYTLEEDEVYEMYISDVIDSVRCPIVIASGPSSVCKDDSRAASYAGKNRIFNDYVDEEAYANCILGDGSVPPLDQSYATLREQALTNLDALKANWLNRLRSMIIEEDDMDRQQGISPRFASLEDPNSSTVNSTVQSLVNNLYALAAKYIEVAPKENIRAASTLPATVSFAYHSFEEIFTAFIGSTLMQQGFNQYLLDKPYPYDQTPVPVNTNSGELDATICSNVSSLQARYQQSGQSGSISFHTYLQQQLQQDYTLTEVQLNDLLARCGNNCRYLDYPVSLPAVFTVPAGNTDKLFVTCSKVSSLKTQFDVAYPSITTDTKLYRVLLTNYLNFQLGYPLSYTDYYVFLNEQCPQNTTAVLYNRPESPTILYDDFTCTADVVAQAYDRAAEEYERYIAIVRRQFRNSYVSRCLANSAAVKLEGDQYEYHYTLYYYDQSGNLVKTIPPEGVRFLSADEILQVQELRNRPVVDCNGAGIPVGEDKTVTFNGFSAALQNNSVQAMEMWLYNNSAGTTRQLRIVTPDQKYLWQAAIADKKLWVELYTLQPDVNGDLSLVLTNQSVATIGNISLQDWSHLVVQAANFAGAPWDLYLDGQKLTNIPPGNAPPYPFEWVIEAGYTLPAEELADLKHFRLYNRLASNAEINANYLNNCLSPVDALAVQSNPLILWGRFNIPSVCNNPAAQTAINNNGSLQVNANLGTDTKVFNTVTNNFTMELWVNPQQPHEIDAETNYGFPGVGGQRYAIFPNYMISDNSLSQAGAGISVGTNGVSVYEHSSAYMPAVLVWQGAINGWTHVAVVYNNGTPSLYINGQLVHTGVASAKQFVYPSYNIGGGTYGYMQGGIDEVRIWSVARTPAQISASYQQGLQPGDNNGLLGYWPISPADGSTLLDVSCNTNAVSLPATGYSWQTSGAPVNDKTNIETAGIFIVPQHGLPTNYAYNSLNGVVKQSSPDAGTAKFWYDPLGRIVASQNAEQATTSEDDYYNPPNRYSYTYYDALGRITETGEQYRTFVSLGNPDFLSWQQVADFTTSGNTRQRTITVYDAPPTWAPAGIVQHNLRKRVTATRYDQGFEVITYQFNNPNSTYYSYDISGNVEELVQENIDLKNKEQQFITGSDGLKRIRYQYDLVSGKVNKVLYQDGKWDQFYYQYLYDADNRLIKSLSSRNNYSDANLWVTEATNRYYLHGPLARMELGKNKVQGLDYAYTLQGWLKGINNNYLSPDDDMGQDGKAGTPFANSARDMFGFSLGYYDHDYTAIDQTNAKAFGLQYQFTQNATFAQPLYNGNITHTTLSVKPLSSGQPVGYTYRYDQLNRLKSMRSHTGFAAAPGTWSSASNLTGGYNEDVTYDGNGNITTYRRNADNNGSTGLMDDLTYNYNKDADGHLINNRLRHVNDNVPAAAYNTDIDNQNDDQYEYDAVGNLVNGDGRIGWNVYRKIIHVNTSNRDAAGNTTYISTYYRYDAAGNRVGKITSKDAYATANKHTVDFYVRDAVGNVLASYRLDGSNGSFTGYTWQEQDLYGSKRLGMLTPGFTISSSQQLSSDAYAGTNDPVANGIEGLRSYELTNHLDNVLATISDKKTGIDDNNDGTTDYYQADVLTAHDYYPFGMLMPGRKWDNGAAYKYGFNGKENDDELLGEGNLQDYGMRIYNPRLGKFLSVDPLTKKYPWFSPYQFAGNSPILNIDLDGLENEPTQPNTQSNSTEELKKKSAEEINRINKVLKDLARVEAHARKVLKEDHSVDLSKFPKYKDSKDIRAKLKEDLAKTDAIYDAIPEYEFEESWILNAPSGTLSVAPGLNIGGTGGGLSASYETKDWGFRDHTWFVNGVDMQDSKKPVVTRTFASVDVGGGFLYKGSVGYELKTKKVDGRIVEQTMTKSVNLSVGYLSIETNVLTGEKKYEFGLSGKPEIPPTGFLTPEAEVKYPIFVGEMKLKKK